jgi:hypothetical protein
MFDFGVGYSELFILALIAVIGQFMAKARGMAREFQGHVDAAMKDAGVEDLKKTAQGLKSELSGASVIGGAAATQARSSNDFDQYFGPSPEPGETRVKGEPVTGQSST